MKSHTEPGLLAAAQVAAVAGVSTRSLQRWVRQGLTPATVERPGKGGEYLFNFRDTLRVIVLRRLRDSGLSMQSLRRGLAILNEQWGQTDPLAGGGLVALDGELFYAPSPAELWHVLTAQGACRDLLIVDVGAAAAELREQAPELLTMAA